MPNSGRIGFMLQEKSSIFLRTIALLALTFFRPVSLWAESEEKQWALDTTVGFYSDYMLRGLQLYDGAAIQPSTTFSWDEKELGKFSGTVWSHLSAEGETSASEKFTEIDYTLKYDYAFEDFGIALGHLWYRYPGENSFRDTAEFLGTVYVDTTLNPIFTIFEDYDTYTIQYYEVGFSEPIGCEGLGKDFAITPFVNFGFVTNGSELYASNGFVQTTFGVTFTLQLGDISVTPSFNYTAEADDNAQNEFWTGTSLSYSF